MAGKYLRIYSKSYSGLLWRHLEVAIGSFGLGSVRVISDRIILGLNCIRFGFGSVRFAFGSILVRACGNSDRVSGQVGSISGRLMFRSVDFRVG